MTLRAKTLIAATALATLSATCAFAADSSSDFAQPQYGSWNDSSSTAIGSQINNSQTSNQTSFSSLSGSIDTVGGDAMVDGTAAGNLVDVTTMNNTSVKNSQSVGPNASIASDVNVDVNNVWGNVSISNQAVCNGASVSTDPTYSASHSFQQCQATDPAQQINTNVSNVGGNVAITGASLGNSFEADSNAPNMPVWSKQINNSTVASTVNANVYNVGGNTTMSSSAIGNTAQVIHYSTN